MLLSKLVNLADVCCHLRWGGFSSLHKPLLRGSARRRLNTLSQFLAGLNVCLGLAASLPAQAPTVPPVMVAPPELLPGTMQTMVPTKVGEWALVGQTAAPTTLPVLPEMQPRPMNAPGDPAGISAAVPQAPTSSLVSGVSSSDAIIELLVGQGKTILLKKTIAKENALGVIAVGDPSVADFDILPNPRLLRVIGKRAGITDLTIATADDEILTLQLQVMYDLELIRAQLQRLYPDCQLKISQLRENLILEGQVRTSAQATQIRSMLEGWIASQQVVNRGNQTAGGPAQATQPENAQPNEGQEAAAQSNPVRDTAGIEERARGRIDVRAPAGQVVNLLRIPGTQQVLLQVRVAELNRTGLREVGADMLIGTRGSTLLGTSIGAGGLYDSDQPRDSRGTAFGIFPSADFDILLRILRRNALVSVLAEPNLVAMSGQEANFLAGGQFPVPVQSGLAATPTIQYKDFGVQLRFVPTILDEDTIRLAVAPEVSTIDESLGTTIIEGGTPTPGIITRRVNTTVEMHQGETLALAGMLQVAVDARTSRIPGLGDLPYIGPLFSNTSHSRVEKELLVLVTPFLITPSSECQDLPYPGQSIQDPNNLEFYLLNRIEGRVGRPFDSATSWENPLGLVEKLKLEQQCINGPVGFSR